MNSYSQYRQDLLLFQQYLYPYKNGYFVDIGANDGKTFSNSLMYEELGWDGVCVEPHHRAFEVLASTRKCLCLNTAICEETKVMKYLKVNGAAEMLSGILVTQDPRHLKRIQRENSASGGYSEVIDISVYTFTDAANKYNIPSTIHYMSIDVEGGEMGVLKGIDFNVFKIYIIGIENNFAEDHVRKYMETKNFKFAGHIAHDDVYINCNWGK